MARNATLRTQGLADKSSPCLKPRIYITQSRYIASVVSTKQKPPRLKRRQQKIMRIRIVTATLRKVGYYKEDYSTSLDRMMSRSHIRHKIHITLNHRLFQHTINISIPQLHVLGGWADKQKIKSRRKPHEPHWGKNYESKQIVRQSSRRWHFHPSSEHREACCVRTSTELYLQNIPGRNRVVCCKDGLQACSCRTTGKSTLRHTHKINLDLCSQ